MIAGLYGFMGATVAMLGVAVGILVNTRKKVDRIEALLESMQQERA